MELHTTLTCQSQDQLTNSSVVGQVLLLERSSNCLDLRTDEDYRRAYDHCASEKLKPEEKRRLLDYCQTRTNRAKHLNSMNRKMVQRLTKSSELEAESNRQRLEPIFRQLRALMQKVDERTRHTERFVELQLSHIIHDQQALLVQNQIALSEIQIQESRKAIEQTETVRKLTMLAFIFIPTSTICSFFGMNVKEMDNHPRIWIFFASLLVVLAITVTIATAEPLLKLLMRLFAAMPVLRLIGEDHQSPLYSFAARTILACIHAPFAMLYKMWRSLARRGRLIREEGEEFQDGYNHPDRDDKVSGGLPNSVCRERGVRVAYSANEKLRKWKRQLKWPATNV
jgi:CorA-like Mg2+ transporter protein